MPRAPLVTIGWTLSGFSLENFDALGSWRDQELGASIDADGRLPGGRVFRGPEGLKSALLARPRAFTRCLVEKMLTFALRPRRGAGG